MLVLVIHQHWKNWIIIIIIIIQFLPVLVYNKNDYYYSILPVLVYIQQERAYLLCVLVTPTLAELNNNIIIQFCQCWCITRTSVLAMRISVVLESSLWCSKCVTCMDFTKNASFASFGVIKILLILSFLR